MITFASLVEDAVGKKAPIYGVSIGRRNDKSKWRIDFKPEATEQQRQQALNVIVEFDIQSAEEQIEAQPLITAEKIHAALKKKNIIDDDDLRRSR